MFHFIRWVVCLLALAVSASASTQNSTLIANAPSSSKEDDARENHLRGNTLSAQETQDVILEAVDSREINQAKGRLKFIPGEDELNDEHNAYKNRRRRRASRGGKRRRRRASRGGKRRRRRASRGGKRRRRRARRGGRRRRRRAKRRSARRRRGRRKQKTTTTTTTKKRPSARRRRGRRTTTTKTTTTTTTTTITTTTTTTTTITTTTTTTTKKKAVARRRRGRRKRRKRRRRRKSARRRRGRRKRRRSRRESARRRRGRRKRRRKESARRRRGRRKRRRKESARRRRGRRKRRRVPKRGARHGQKPPPKLPPPEPARKERDLDKDFERFKRKFGKVHEIRNEKVWDLAGPNWPGNVKKPLPISKVVKNAVDVNVYIRTEMLPEKMTWSIWDEKDNKVCHGGPYVHWYSWHKFTCKLEKGKTYTLKCKDPFGEGWGEGFLQINGYYYCYDYIFDGGFEQVEFMRV